MGWLGQLVGFLQYRPGKAQERVAFLIGFGKAVHHSVGSVWALACLYMRGVDIMRQYGRSKQNSSVASKRLSGVRVGEEKGLG